VTPTLEEVSKLLELATGLKVAKNVNDFYYKSRNLQQADDRTIEAEVYQVHLALYNCLLMS